MRPALPEMPLLYTRLEPIYCCLVSFGVRARNHCYNQPVLLYGEIPILNCGFIKGFGG